MYSATAHSVPPASTVPQSNWGNAHWGTPAGPQGGFKHPLGQWGHGDRYDKRFLRYSDKADDYPEGSRAVLNPNGKFTKLKPGEQGHFLEWDAPEFAPIPELFQLLFNDTTPVALLQDTVNNLTSEGCDRLRVEMTLWTPVPFKFKPTGELAFKTIIGKMVENYSSRGQWYTPDAGGAPKSCRWDKPGDTMAWYNYAYFPAVRYDKPSHVMACRMMAVHYANWKPSDRLAGHVCKWVPVNVRDGQMHVDIGIFPKMDMNSLRSLQAAITCTSPSAGSFMWFSDQTLADKPLPEGPLGPAVWPMVYHTNFPGIRGASLGLAIASCVVGNMPCVLTGYLRKVPDLANYPKPAWDQTSGAITSANAAEAVRVDDIVEDVQCLSTKAAFCAYYNHQIIMPHKGFFGQDLQKHIIGKNKPYEPDKQYMLAMGKRFYSTVQLSQGIPIQSDFVGVLLATTLAECAQLSALTAANDISLFKNNNPWHPINMTDEQFAAIQANTDIEQIFKSQWLSTRNRRGGLKPAKKDNYFPYSSAGSYGAAGEFGADGATDWKQSFLGGGNDSMAFWLRYKKKKPATRKKKTTKRRRRRSCSRSSRSRSSRSRSSRSSGKGSMYGRRKKRATKKTTTKRKKRKTKKETATTASQTTNTSSVASQTSGGASDMGSQTSVGTDSPYTPKRQDMATQASQYVLPPHFTPPNAGRSVSIAGATPIYNKGGYTTAGEYGATSVGTNTDVSHTTDVSHSSISGPSRRNWSRVMFQNFRSGTKAMQESSVGTTQQEEHTPSVPMFDNMDFPVPASRTRGGPPKRVTAEEVARNRAASAERRARAKKGRDELDDLFGQPLDVPGDITPNRMRAPQVPPQQQALPPDTALAASPSVGSSAMREADRAPARRASSRSRARREVHQDAVLKLAHEVFDSIADKLIALYPMIGRRNQRAPDHVMEIAKVLDNVRTSMNEWHSVNDIVSAIKDLIVASAEQITRVSPIDASRMDAFIEFMQQSRFKRQSLERRLNEFIVELRK